MIIDSRIVGSGFVVAGKALTSFGYRSRVNVFKRTAWSKGTVKLMFVRFINASVLFLLLALAALGIERLGTDVVRIKIKAFDRNNHLVNDMRQEEFALRVDEADKEHAFWIKEQ